MIGVHRWVRNHNPEDGDTAATARAYRECERCHKEDEKDEKSLRHWRYRRRDCGGWDGAVGAVATAAMAVEPRHNSRSSALSRRPTDFAPLVVQPAAAEHCALAGRFRGPGGAGRAVACAFGPGPHTR